MKKMVKIVLITVLVALPALGTYVKTTLPNLGSAPDLTIKRTAESINPGYCLERRIDVSVNCNNSGNWSEFADPIAGGISDPVIECGQDFPVDFLFKTIPFQQKNTDQSNVAAMKPGKKITAAML